MGTGLAKLRWSDPDAEQAAESDAFDLRFRRLLGETAWAKLPAAVQARFAKHLGLAQGVVYRGKVLETHHSRLGWLLAQACRLIGAPLPLQGGHRQAALVHVGNHAPSGGQCWTRIYSRACGFPQTIASAKQFSGPTGLEEYLGHGIGMALRAEATASGLVFRSDHYFLRLGSWRLPIPHWLGPGRTTVTHRDLGQGRFAFDLRLDHPLFGPLIVQRAEFHDE